MPEMISRRDWIQASGLAACWAEVAAAQQHAHEAARSGGTTAFQHFDKETAVEIEALVSQIIPTDGTPGAREAGVIYFIDRALAGFDRDKQKLYAGGLAQAQAKRRELFPSSRSIAGLSAEEQVRLLESIEKSEFFEALRFHTILGFLGDSSHGGNREQIGWKLIGFEDRHQFEPPFGYYDAPAVQKKQ